jgi:hypothetical protein
MDISTWNAVNNNGWVVDATDTIDSAYEACNLPSPAPISGWSGGATTGGMEATFSGIMPKFHILFSDRNVNVKNHLLKKTNHTVLYSF